MKKSPFTTTANRIFPKVCIADLRSLDSASKGKSLKISSNRLIYGEKDQ